MLILAFVAGKYSERLFYGRWYTVHDDTAYPFDAGTVHLKHVTDTQGIPFLDPGSSVITFDDDEFPETLLYTSKRMFQEDSPWIDKLQVKGNEVRWTDGHHQFTITIEPKPRAATMASTAASTKP